MQKIKCRLFPSRFRGCGNSGERNVRDMNDEIKLLDCTLRDGSYITGGEFGETAIRGIISKMQEAGVEIIECGWLKNDPYRNGSSFYHVPSDLERYIAKKDSRLTYAVMIDWDRYDLELLPECDGRSVDAVRIVFPRQKYREGIETGLKIKEKGYEIFYQAANTMDYSDDELLRLAEAVNAAKPSGLSIVDTFGAMYPEDLERITGILGENTDTDISLGFHSHNNQQLSFALTMDFVKMLSGSGRKAIVDASLCGMGRGAGNATTELAASFLNRKCGCNYNMDAIMDAIDIYMEYFRENYRWGYSTPYFIAGLYCCHVNNIAYLLDNHRTKAKDMRNIIESLPPQDRKRYDYDLLEKKYFENQSLYADDGDTVKYLSEEFAGRTVLLAAPGKSALSRQDKVLRYISEKDPVVIGVNAILKGYDYDYVFFTNSARYEYAKNAYAEVFGKVKKILLSNIKKAPDEGELIIGFNSVTKRGWKHFDNAAICCFRMLDMLGVKKAAVAGFDGFKTKYNESYADPFLPTLNPDNKWDELNEEIKDIFADFKRCAVNCRDIEFVTPGIFDI